MAAQSYSQHYYRSMRRVQARINAYRARGECPVCYGPSGVWKDSPTGERHVTCGKKECVEAWIRHGGPAPKEDRKQRQKKREHRAYLATSYLHDDAAPVARSVGEREALVAQGEMLFEQDAIQDEEGEELAYA